jgi:hypothetical protein
MRYARLLTEPSLVEKALEMADYGSRLPKDLQYAGEAPFEDQFPTHLMLFRATLGRNVDEALAYFAGRARAEAGELGGEQAGGEAGDRGKAGEQGNVQGDDAQDSAEPMPQQFASQTTTAIETYLILLNRAGRPADALAAYAELVPKGRELSPFAPTPLELATASGGWELYDQICQRRDDMIGYAAGVLARAAPRKNP